MYDDALAYALSTPPEVNPQACPPPDQQNEPHALDGVYVISSSVPDAPRVFFEARRTGQGVDITLVGQETHFEFIEHFRTDLEAGRIQPVQSAAQGDPKELLEEIDNPRAEHLHRRLGGAGYRDHYAFCADRYGRPFESLTELTKAEADDLHDWLDRQNESFDEAGERPRVPPEARSPAPPQPPVAA